MLRICAIAAVLFLRPLVPIQCSDVTEFKISKAYNADSCLAQTFNSLTSI